MINKTFKHTCTLSLCRSVVATSPNTGNPIDTEMNDKIFLKCDFKDCWIDVNFDH